MTSIRLYTFIACALVGFILFQYWKQPLSSPPSNEEYDEKALVRNPELHQGMEQMFEKKFQERAHSDPRDNNSNLPNIHEYLETADEMYIPPEGVSFHPNGDTSRELGLTRELNERADRKMRADEIVILQQEIQEDEEIIQKLFSQGLHERAREIQGMLELKRHRLTELESISTMED